MAYKYTVTVIGIGITDTVFAYDADEAKRKFCKKRGLDIDHTRLTARRVQDEL